MFSLGSTHSYYLYGSPVDMRKSFDGLCGLVRNHLDKDPSSGVVYVFLNRSRNLIKLLHWEQGGYVQYYKRLEQGTFTPPEKTQTGGPIRWPELVMMAEGILLQGYKQKKRYQNRV